MLVIKSKWYNSGETEGEQPHRRWSVFPIPFPWLREFSLDLYMLVAFATVALTAFEACYGGLLVLDAGWPPAETGDKYKARKGLFYICGAALTYVLGMYLVPILGLITALALANGVRKALSL